MNKEGNCYFCGEPYKNYGHNPEPLAKFEQRCCEACNDTKVIPTRIELAFRRQARGGK